MEVPCVGTVVCCTKRERRGIAAGLIAFTTYSTHSFILCAEAALTSYFSSKLRRLSMLSEFTMPGIAMPIVRPSLHVHAYPLGTLARRILTSANCHIDIGQSRTGLRLTAYWFSAEQVVRLSWHYVYSWELPCLLLGTQVAWVSSAFGLEGLALPHCGDWPCLSPGGPTIVRSFCLTLLVADFVSLHYCLVHPVHRPCGPLSCTLPCSMRISSSWMLIDGV